MRKFLSVLLAVMMVLSTVSFAAPSIAGSTETAVETPVVEVPVEEEAELAAVSSDVSTYGTLIFNLDFEDSTYPSGGSISNCGPVNSYISADNEIVLPEEFGSAYFRIGMPNAYEGSYNTTMNGTNVLPVVANNQYPYFTLQAFSSSSDWTRNAVVLPTGYYTVVGDFAKDANNGGAGLVKSRIGNNGGQTSGSQQSITTTMTTYTHQLVLEESATEGYYQFRGPNSNDTVCGPHAAISAIGTYFGDSTVGDIYYVDNYKMYWKPLTAKVTLTSDAEYLTLPESFEVPTTGVAVSELVANVKKAAVYYDITGVKVNGTEYGIDETVTITKDCEVEVLSEENTEYTSEWLDKRYGTLLFKSDFDSADVGSIDDIMGDDNERLAAFKATSEMNPYFSEYSSMSGSMLLGSANITSAEIVADLALGSNVLKITTSSGYYSQINYITPYNQRAVCDIVNSTTGVYTIVHKYKTTTGKNPTYRYNGFKNDGEMTGNGGDDSQDAQTSTDLGNGYTEWVATYNMVEDYCIDTFKLHVDSNSATGDTYFDDIKVYWKPASVDVEIADCDVKGVTVENKSLTGVATSGTVSEFLTLAGVDYSAVSGLSYVFRGVSVASNPSEVYGLDDTLYLFEDSKVNLVFEKVDMSEWTDPEKGILLFDIAFDQNPGWTTYQYLTSCATLNPYFADTNYSDKWYIQTAYMDTQHTISNGEFVGKLDAGKQFPQIQIQANHPDVPQNTFGGSGVYYVEADMYVSENSEMKSMGITPHKMINGTSTQVSGISETMTDGMAGSYQTISGTIDASDCEGVSKIILLWSRTSASVTTTPTVKYDNVRLYWKPTKVDVTIEGGVNEAFEAVTLEDVSTSSTIDEIIAMIPGTVDDYGQLTGLADENGNKLTSFSAVTDVTLQPLWTPWNVIEGAGQEFAINGEFHSGTKTQFASSSFGTTDTIGDGSIVTKAFITMYKGNGTNYDGYGIYTADNNLVYKQLTPNAGDSNVHGSNTYTDDYTVAAVPAGSSHRVTINLNLAAGNTAKYIVVKYKFQNVPDLTSDFAAGLGAVASDDGKSATYTTRSGGTATYSNLVDYTGKYYIKTQTGGTQYVGGKEFEAGKEAAGYGDGVTVDIEALNDEWIYDLVPVDATMNSDGVAQILIDRPNHFRDMITVWDYVMVIGDGTELDPIVPEQPTPEYGAPETDTEKASIRTDSPMGIRFRAFMSGDTSEVATDYGWVVARKTVVENAGYTLDDVTVDQEAFKVILGYGRENGVDLKSFYDETDDLKTFTAVIYNLPSGMEADVIVSRPFVKLDGEYFYGEPAAKSIYEVAVAIREGGYEGLGDYAIGKINAIIAAVEA